MIHIFFLNARKTIVKCASSIFDEHTVANNSAKS